MQSANKGIFLTIEGGEGVGKSTALTYIQDYLLQTQKKFVITREPGGTPLAEQIRQVLLKPNLNETMTPDTELLLMFACRAQHIATLIKPHLLAGSWVVSDRFIDASYAYQAGGRGLDLAKIQLLDQWIVGDLKPHLTILLDAPPAVGLARAKHRGPQDRIEQETIDFFERVRAQYLLRAQHEPERFRIIDATQPLADVEAALKKILDELMT